MSDRLLLSVSVIIPVYNDGERLRSCLQALAQQTYPTDCYEVIVVDNGSDARANIQGIVQQFEGTISEFESTPGSYAARNKGISIAKGEIIAFTDADCIPTSNWIEKGVAHLQETVNCGLVGGKYRDFLARFQ